MKKKLIVILALTLMLAGLLLPQAQAAPFPAVKPNNTGFTRTSVPVTGVKLNRTSVTLSTLKTSLELRATVTPSNATNKVLSWHSSNTKVAVVKNGIVTPKGYGTAKITVNCGGKTATCTVKIIRPVTSVTPSRTSLTMVEGEKTTLQITIKPSNATEKKLSYSSSNTKVLKVNSSGQLTAVKEGKATLTITAHNGKKATVAVTVKRDIQLKFSSSSLVLHAKMDLNMANRLTLKGISKSSLRFTSSNSAVASINEKTGQLSLKGYGTTTVTVKASGYSATCKVTIPKHWEQTKVFSVKDKDGKVIGEDVVSIYISDPLTAKKIIWTITQEANGTYEPKGTATLSANTTTAILQSRWMDVRNNSASKKDGSSATGSASSKFGGAGVEGSLSASTSKNQEESSGTQNSTYKSISNRYKLTAGGSIQKIN